MTKSTSSLWRTLGTFTITCCLPGNQCTLEGRAGELLCGFQSPVSITLSSPQFLHGFLSQPRAHCFLLSPHKCLGGGEKPDWACLTGLHSLSNQALSDPTCTKTLPILSNICFMLLFLLALLLFGREMNLTQAFAPCEESKALCCFHVLSPSQVGRKPWSYISLQKMECCYEQQQSYLRYLTGIWLDSLRMPSSWGSEGIWGSRVWWEHNSTEEGIRML